MVRFNRFGRVLAALAVTALFSARLFAASVPALKGRVNDYAKIIRDSDEREIEEYLSGLESSTGIQIAVLTMPSLEGDISHNEWTYCHKCMGVLLQKHCHFATNHCHFCTILPKLSRARYSSRKFLREKKGDNRGLITSASLLLSSSSLSGGKKGERNLLLFLHQIFAQGRANCQSGLRTRIYVKAKTYIRDGEFVYT